MNLNPAVRLLCCCLGLAVLCSYHGPHVHSTNTPTFVQTQTVWMATSSAVIGRTIPSNITITWGFRSPEST